MFPFYTLTILLPLTFSFFLLEQSTNTLGQRLLNNFPRWFQIHCTAIENICHPMFSSFHHYIYPYIAAVFLVIKLNEVSR